MNDNNCYIDAFTIILNTDDDDDDEEVLPWMSTTQITLTLTNNSNNINC